MLPGANPLNPIVFIETVVRSFLRHQLKAYSVADVRGFDPMLRWLPLLQFADAWTPISTNALAAGWAALTDSEWKSQPAPFQRVRMQ